MPSAIERPIPRFPPVMTATRPLSSKRDEVLDIRHRTSHHLIHRRCGDIYQPRHGERRVSQYTFALDRRTRPQPWSSGQGTPDSDRVSVGFNLDLAGFATGASKTTGTLTARVPSGSLFLGGAGDLGALNSETYVAVRLIDRIALRVGTSHFVTNYSVREPAKVATPDVRYQKFETMPFLAIAVRF